MDNNELDIIVFEDEDGNEIEFELLFTFEHEEEEFAVLQESEDVSDDSIVDIYIFKIEGDGEEEEFVQVEEERMDELIAVVESILEEELDD